MFGSVVAMAIEVIDGRMSSRAADWGSPAVRDGPPSRGNRSWGMERDPRSAASDSRGLPDASTETSMWRIACPTSPERISAGYQFHPNGSALGVSTRLFSRLATIDGIMPILLRGPQVWRGFGRARLRPSLAKRGSDGASPSRTSRGFRDSNWDREPTEPLRHERSLLSRPRLLSSMGGGSMQVSTFIRSLAVCMVAPALWADSPAAWRSLRSDRMKAHRRFPEPRPRLRGLGISIVLPSWVPQCRPCSRDRPRS